MEEEDFTMWIHLEVDAGKTFDEATIEALRKDIAKLDGGDVRDVKIEKYEDAKCEVTLVTKAWPLPSGELQAIAQKHSMHIKAGVERCEVVWVTLTCWINSKGEIEDENEDHEIICG